MVERMIWITLLVASLAWGYTATSVSAELRIQNDLLRQLGSAQLRFYRGTELANVKCGQALSGILQRLGLDTELEPLLTSAVLRRYDIGGIGGFDE